MASSTMNESVNMNSNSELQVLDKQSTHSEGAGDESKTNKRARTLSSSVWNYYTRMGVGDDGKERAQCKACGKDYVCGGSRYGTSTLQRHISKCEKMPKFSNVDVGKLMIDQTGKLRSRKVDQRLLREMISMAIIEHDLPFSFVEYRRVREIMKYLNPDAKMMSRRASTTDVLNLYLSKKNKLKQVLSNIPSRICLTSDVWTSCTTEGYISLTAHFVDENWKLNSKILSFAHFPPPHSGLELAKTVFEFLQEWGIEKKIFSLTLDNASSNDNMQELLKERLLLQSDGLLSGGEFFYV